MQWQLHGHEKVMVLFSLCWDWCERVPWTRWVDSMIHFTPRIIRESSVKLVFLHARISINKEDFIWLMPEIDLGSLSSLIEDYIIAAYMMSVAYVITIALCRIFFQCMQLFLLCQSRYLVTKFYPLLLPLSIGLNLFSFCLPMILSLTGLL